MKPKYLGILIVIVMGGVFLLTKNTLSPSDGVALQELIKSYKSRGIQVELNAPLSGFPNWKDAQGSSQPISFHEAARVLSVLWPELDYYPKAVLEKNLEAFYLYGDLTLYGAKYGGTQLDKKLFIISAGERAGYSDQFIRETFHHELSSILMRYNEFPVQKWRTALPKGFSYVQDSKSWEKEKAVINQGIDNTTGQYYLNRGFINEYGTTSFENDVNTYAEYYFVHKEQLQQWAQTYPAIDEKLNLFKTFLASLGMSIGEN